MNIFTKSFQAPNGFETEACSCFFTDTTFYQSDYEAVIASREDLRIWSDSDWPEDDFTPEVNRDDLQYHVDDNKTHEAYGYMLYDPSREHCYGSLYVNPLEGMVDNYEFLDGSPADLDQYDARIDYWLNTAIRDQHLQLSQTIYAWIREQWPMHACFTAREGATDRIALYESLGLHRRLSLRYRETGNVLFLYS